MSDTYKVTYQGAHNAVVVNHVADSFEIGADGDLALYRKHVTENATVKSTREVPVAAYAANVWISVSLVDSPSDKVA